MSKKNRKRSFEINFPIPNKKVLKNWNASYLDGLIPSSEFIKGDKKVFLIKYQRTVVNTEISESIIVGADPACRSPRTRRGGGRGAPAYSVDTVPDAVGLGCGFTRATQFLNSQFPSEATGVS
ncbi:unnamed protein product [Leptosia nina]|uniref:Uncharacterized protein n=1 Tax=Leptosia nina TaxID=320188 RepID=A0AAV1JJW1_9NEOP